MMISNQLKEGATVALYARVSTDEQREKKTIDSQIEQLTKFAESHKYKIYEIYQDAGITGESLSRPGLDKLRFGMVDHKFDAVLITCPDRLSRKPLFQNIVEEEAAIYKVPIVFLNAGKVPETPEDALLIGIQGEIARYEREKIKERTRRAKLFKARQGVLITSHPPYGYDYIKRSLGGPKYVVNEEEAEVVRLIFKLFIKKDIGIRGVVTELKKRKIKPRCGKDTWGKSMVAKILLNETYIGKTYYNKNIRTPVRDIENLGREAIFQTPRYVLRKRSKDEWIGISVPSIIDEKTFNKTHERLLWRKHFFRRPQKHQYLLSGLIYCGQCNHRLCSTPYRNGPYYRCRNITENQGNKIRCKVKSVSAVKVDTQIWKIIIKILNNPRMVISYIKRITEHKDRDIKQLQERLAFLNKKIDQIKEYEGKAYELYIKNVYKETELNVQLEKLKLERMMIDKEKESVEKEINSNSDIPINYKPSIKLVDDCLKYLLKSLDKITFEEKKDLMKHIIDRVVYDGEKLVVKGYIPVFSLKNGGLKNRLS